MKGALKTNTVTDDKPKFKMYKNKRVQGDGVGT